jgi:hypothetical protein
LGESDPVDPEEQDQSHREAREYGCVSIQNHLCLLHNQLAAHHVHAAGKIEFAFLVWRQRDDNWLIQWQIALDAEVAQDNLRGARLVCGSEER